MVVPGYSEMLVHFVETAREELPEGPHLEIVR